MKQRSEADLRGAITNDSMTDEEKRLYLEEQQHAEESPSCATRTISLPMPSTSSRA